MFGQVNLHDKTNGINPTNWANKGGGGTISWISVRCAEKMKKECNMLRLVAFLAFALCLNLVCTANVTTQDAQRAFIRQSSHSHHHGHHQIQHHYNPNSKFLISMCLCSNNNTNYEKECFSIRDFVSYLCITADRVYINKNRVKWTWCHFTTSYFS